eukprot:1179253-Prorocentrum_minimum.AAC.1
MPKPAEHDNPQVLRERGVVLADGMVAAPRGPVRRLRGGALRGGPGRARGVAKVQQRLRPSSSRSQLRIMPARYANEPTDGYANAHILIHGRMSR